MRRDYREQDQDNLTVFLSEACMLDYRPMNTVGVVGLGYVGLPLALAFAEAGATVIGVDTDSNKIAAIGSGVSPVEDVRDEQLNAAMSSGKIRAVEDYAALEEAEAVIICLPTPLNEHREPDLTPVIEGAENIARSLRSGALVVLESTTYPGTTREVLLPIFERAGRRVGDDFYLAFSPERVDPGNRKYKLRNTPRVVGGISAECSRRATELYSKIADNIHPVSGTDEAEMTKLLENIFRGVNIALVNEFAILCNRMGLDVWEVVEAAATKPFGFMPFYPGPGLGGHCIPIDPFYLSWRARAFDMTAEFIELAGRTNVNMPYYASERIAAALNAEKKPVNGSRILVLGVAYKPNVGDLRESPSLKILELLRGSGADVVYHDPYVSRLPNQDLDSVPLTKQEIAEADCVAIATDHDSLDVELVVGTASKVVDLRNAVRTRLGSPLPDNVDVL